MDNTKTAEFILTHRDDDPRDLALHASRFSDVDMPYAVRQISAWQMARRKLPLWASTENIIYPVHLSMEQCSSQLTAEYKAGIVEGGESMTDLTAGFGVDATMIGRRYKHLNYVERTEELCSIAAHNLPLLGICDYDIYNTDAVDILSSLPHQQLIYLDPARRDENGAKTVRITDCTPDVTSLQNSLLALADTVMIKLSPMLDLTDVVRELKCVQQVHIVSVENECKEVLVVMSGSADKVLEADKVNIHCINIKKDGCLERYVFSMADERTALCHYAAGVKQYLYEPNVSIMKAGCFKSIAQSYHIEKLHPMSHLYTSDSLIDDFPGRVFKVDSVFGMKDKELKRIKKANLTVRNFPSSVADLRKRLKLSEGGDIYLFATTLSDESHVIISGVKK